jgi:hypothetical protein
MKKVFGFFSGCAVALTMSQTIYAKALTTAVMSDIQLSAIAGGLPAVCSSLLGSCPIAAMPCGVLIFWSCVIGV